MKVTKPVDKKIFMSLTIRKEIPLRKILAKPSISFLSSTFFIHANRKYKYVIRPDQGNIHTTKLPAVVNFRIYYGRFSQVTGNSQNSIISLAITAFLYFPTQVSLATSTCFSFKMGRGTQRPFSKNICLGDDLRSRFFGTFVIKFLASLPELGFSNI